MRWGAQRGLVVPGATDLELFEVLRYLPLGLFGCCWGINRVIEVGGRVFPDDKSPLANCHIK